MAEVKEELKPCPFCGGKASINYERISGEHKGFWAQVISVSYTHMTLPTTSRV